MRINHNIAALNTYNKLNSASGAQSKSMEKLSSGLRINRAGDDAAGLAISEKMRGQIRGLDMASKNSQDAISLIQTAEGALNETHDILQRMRELATQAANDTNTKEDRGEIQKEINSLTSEINRIGNTTEFNTQKLLNGDKDTNFNGTGATIANATIGGQAGFTVSSGVTNGAIGNIKIEFSEGTTAGASFNAAGDTLTVTLTGTATNVTASDIETLIQNATTTNAPAGVSMSDFTVTGGTTIDVTAVTVAAATDSFELTGGRNEGQALSFQIGANQNQSLSLEITDMRAVNLGISTVGTTNPDLAVTDGTSNLTTEQALDVSTHTNAASAVTKIQEAIDKVSAERSKLGANQNRLEHTINNLGTSAENLTAAESRIRDVDMAKEMMSQTKNSILSQAAQAMLAQANQQPQGVLQLLR